MRLQAAEPAGRPGRRALAGLLGMERGVPAHPPGVAFPSAQVIIRNTCVSLSGFTFEESPPAPGRGPPSPASPRGSP